MRGFAALHLLAMYLGVVAGLPGLPVHRYLPHGARHIFRLLGLWAPRPTAMLPVLVAMLLVRFWGCQTSCRRCIGTRSAGTRVHASAGYYLFHTAVLLHPACSARQLWLICCRRSCMPAWEHGCALWPRRSGSSSPENQKMRRPALPPFLRRCCGAAAWPSPSARWSSCCWYALCIQFNHMTFQLMIGMAAYRR